MLGIYNYTVILTYIGMLAGFTGMVCTYNGDIQGALLCLMAAGVCDMFDGKIASTMERTRQEKRFGIQIDSLSDLICFGVLPALIVYASGSGALRIIPSALYLLCALIRLAWFNVDEEERQDREGGRRQIYFGLPVTSAALIFPIVLGLGMWQGGSAATVVMVITALAFLAPIPIKKPSLHGKRELTLSGAAGTEQVSK